MGAGSTHNPFFAFRASFSSFSSSVSSGAYFLFHQHHPALTSAWLMFVPSSKNTSAKVRPYLSWPWVWRMTSLPKTNADAACFARSPKAWPSSGQSIPLSLIGSGWVLCRTSIMSPAKTETTGPEKLAAAIDGTNRIRTEAKVRTTKETFTAFFSAAPT